MDYPNNDIQASSPGNPGPSVCGSPSYSENATACEALCDATAACAGFVHYADNNCCYMKSRLVNPTANSRTTSHSKTGYTGAHQYVVQYGQDYPYNDITPPAGAPSNIGQCGNSATQESIGDCIARCDNNPACVGIAHYAGNLCCYQKSIETGQTQRDGVASYKKLGLNGAR